MNEGSGGKGPVLIFLLLILALLACRITVPKEGKGSQAQQPGLQTKRVGFPFTSRLPHSPEGDTAAPLHLFIHRYPVPGKGFISGITYLNDSDAIPEAFTLLILRPVNRGWEIIHRLELSDDRPPARTGLTILLFPYPLPVEKGDIFAHWQPDPGGAIPLNLDGSSVEGLSAGKHGFRSAEIEVGRYIPDQGFTGERDYFINLIFEARPKEP